jgi:hypothetical protein
MKIICAMALSFLALAYIPETRIKDRDIIKALDIYLDSLNSKVQDQPVKYHLIGRIDNSESQKIIYVSATPFVGGFWNNIPDEYSHFRDRLVFWYKTKKDSHDPDAYHNFHEQFKQHLINDRSTNGINDSQVETKYIGLEFIGSYRFVVKKGKVESVRKVCSFPDNRFYEKGYKFDSNGNLMFNDGAYDICSIDKPYRLDRDDFDPMDYLRTHSGIPVEITKKYRIGATITIDEKGKPIKFDVDDVEKVLSDKQLNRLMEVALGMPYWNPQTVNNKRVSYRIITKL